MIYYFSGTGNSRFVAETLAKLTNDKCVDIAGVYAGTIKQADGRSDVTGFVFPVYYWGLPEMVKRFASNERIKNSLAPFVYNIVTCGGNPASTYKALEKCLGKEINYSASVLMPDNYVMLYNPASKEKSIELIKEANKNLKLMSANINRKESHLEKYIDGDITSTIFHPLYDVFRNTKKFNVDSKCNGCGKCSTSCPDKAIIMENNQPKWIKDKCQHCTACINGCPTQAIQYANRTKSRGRYHIEKLSESDK